MDAERDAVVKAVFDGDGAETGGVMSRRDALAKRKDILEGPAVEEQATRQRAALEQSHKALKNVPQLFVRSDGIYLNRPKLLSLLADGTSFPVSLPLQERVLGGYWNWDGWNCYSVADVIGWLNRGAAGTQNLGRLELVRIESIADLDGSRGQQLGHLSPAMPRTIGLTPGTVGIENHFAHARDVLLSAGTAPTGKGPAPDLDALPEACHGTVALAAWAAVSGCARRGPVRTVRECLPFEALLGYKGSSTSSPWTIVASRSLKYAGVSPGQALASLAPFELAIDPATGALLHARNLDCPESWRPRLADVAPFVVAVDPVSLRVLYVRPYAPAEAPAEDAAPAPEPAPDLLAEAEELLTDAAGEDADAGEELAGG